MRRDVLTSLLFDNLTEDLDSIRQFVKEHPVQASLITLLFILSLRNASEKQILEATQALQGILEHIQDTQEALSYVEQFLSKELRRSNEEAQV